MPNKPNILLITTDQQHANTIHALGNSIIQTPNLDRMVKEGVAFDRAYCANPVCSPSRSSILTGQYPSTHKCWNIGVALPKENVTLSRALSKQGYQTALFGKAHFQPVLSEGGFESPPNIFDYDFGETGTAHIMVLTRFRWYTAMLMNHHPMACTLAPGLKTRGLIQASILARGELIERVPGICPKNTIIPVGQQIKPFLSLNPETQNKVRINRSLCGAVSRIRTIPT